MIIRTNHVCNFFFFYFKGFRWRI